MDCGLQMGEDASRLCPVILLRTLTHLKTDAARSIFLCPAVSSQMSPETFFHHTFLPSKRDQHSPCLGSRGAGECSKLNPVYTTHRVILDVLLVSPSCFYAHKVKGFRATGDTSGGPSHLLIFLKKPSWGQTPHPTPPLNDGVQQPSTPPTTLEVLTPLGPSLPLSRHLPDHVTGSHHSRVQLRPRRAEKLLPLPASSPGD